MDAVDAAFAAWPREGFLPDEERRRSGYDGPLPIGNGQTNSQPRTVADMLRLLDVRPGQRVLDVGSGSGWTTALLDHLVGPDGAVLGVEIEPALVATGQRHLAEHGCTRSEIRAAVPDTLGLPDDAPYDRILVSAMARTLPEELVSQLFEGGRMVVPVQGRMLRVVRTPRTRHTPDGVEVTRHGSYRFVPLR